MSSRYDEQTVPADVGRLKETTESGSVHPYVLVLTGPTMGSLFRLKNSENLIGRSPEADVLIEDESISREHAVLARSGTGEFVLRDLGSTNGTFKGGRRIATTTVREGERFQIGSTVLLRLSLSEGVEDSFRQLYDASVRDPLTGLHNRRHFGERLDAELSFARRHDRPLTLLMIDIDHFKRVNDTHGHQAGDQTLRKIAEILQGTVRAEDLVARYGGEEFMILAPGIDGAQAESLAERLRSRIESGSLRWKGGAIRVTISAGVASRQTEKTQESSDLIAAADHALYQAKQWGRNRVVRAR